MDQAIFMTSQQVRSMFGGISKMTLWRWLQDEALGFPQPKYFGNRQYFDREAVEAWAGRPGGVRRAAVKATEKRQEIPDDMVDGLYEVVQPSGAVSFAFRFRANGKPVKYTIGSLAEPEGRTVRGVSRREARIAAQALKDMVVVFTKPHLADVEAG
jgi:predicted DNA-binding transcriptional regulator AlpA